jgi:tRNA threonylcarbamoyl adenosine modification protein YeaZ
MIILAIDTASTLCAACILDAEAGKELGRSVNDIGKGHAEHLMAVVEAAMRQASAAYPNLGAIAVSVGPGSFTGVRVGVSAARGFALALKIPAIGVTTLEAIAAEARERFGAVRVMSALDAGRGEINAAVYDELGMLVYGPSVTALSDAADLARKYAPVLAGSAAAAIAAEASGGFDTGSSLATADISFYAKLAARKGAGEKPRPIYLREADAKPQAGFVLPRIGP